MVHDLGLIYAAPRERIELVRARARTPRRAASPKLGELLVAYRTLILEVAEGQAASNVPRDAPERRSRGRRPRARCCRRSSRSPGGDSPWPATLPLDPELVRDLDAQLPALFAAAPRSYEQQILGATSRAATCACSPWPTRRTSTRCVCSACWAGESARAGALAHVDLIAALSSPAANDIVSFSLELLPSVLETRRAHAAGTHPEQGYGGVGREGSIDSMVLTELAWEDAELARRMLEGEMLFYSREQAPTAVAAPSPRRHRRVGLDARRARGLRARPRDRPRQEAPARGRGGVHALLRLAPLRHPARPRQPARGLAPRVQGRARHGTRRACSPSSRRRSRSCATHDARDPVVHVITHAALHVPRHLVQEVRKHAHLFAVFILPSGGVLDLEWLDLLEGYAVVDHATLLQKGARAAAATKIVGDAAKRPA